MIRKFRRNENFDASGLGGTVTASGVFVPDDLLSVSLSVNVNIAPAAANTGYIIQKFMPYSVSFTKASVNEPTGVIGTNVYYSIYDSRGNLILTERFATLAAPAVLSGTLIQGTPFIPAGLLYWVLAVDVPPVTGTICAVPTVAVDLTTRNFNSVKNGSIVGMLSGGLMPTSFNPASIVGATGGHVGSNACAEMYLE